MRRGLMAVMVAGALAGCGGPKPFVRSNFMDHPPKSIAVLPFVITYPYDAAAGQGVPELHRLGRDTFRKTFYYAITPYGYTDRRLAEVDEMLSAGWGPLDEGGWRQASPQLLGETLDAEALVYGDIHRIVYFATPFYTEASIDATLRLVEAATGEELWRQHVVAVERGGAIMKKGQVVDFLQDQARSFDPAVKFLRVCDLGVRRALAGFPNPPMTVAEDAEHEAAARAVRLAILPVDARGKQGWQQPAELLRGHLAASLQESPFEVVEPARVDAALAQAGWTPGAKPTPAQAEAAARAVGAAAMLRASMTRWGRSYWVVESWSRAGLQADLVDVASGEVVWSARKDDSSTAGILKGPTGYSSLATAPIMALRRDNLERIALHLVRQVVAEMAKSPSIITYVNGQFARLQKAATSGT